MLLWDFQFGAARSPTTGKSLSVGVWVQLCSSCSNTRVTITERKKASSFNKEEAIFHVSLHHHSSPGSVPFYLLTVFSSLQPYSVYAAPSPPPPSPPTSTPPPPPPPLAGATVSGEFPSRQASRSSAPNYHLFRFSQTTSYSSSFFLLSADSSVTGLHCICQSDNDHGDSWRFMSWGGGCHKTSKGCNIWSVCVCVWERNRNRARPLWLIQLIIPKGSRRSTS